MMLARPRLAAAFASLAVLVMWCAPAGASGPKLTVAKADLAAAFKCPSDPTDATTTPLMFVTGTGATGEQGYLIGQDAFEAYGHPVCYVNFPDFTTGDIQVSVQYLVYALRREYARAASAQLSFPPSSTRAALPPPRRRCRTSCRHGAHD